MNYWEIVAERLSRSGWSWGCVAVVNDERRDMFVVAAHRSNGTRYVVRSDEKLTTLLEIERVTRIADHHWRAHTIIEIITVHP